MQRGNGYEGGSGQSTANQSILTFPVNSLRKEFYDLDFLNTQSCNIKVNGSDRLIPCPANVGFSINSKDAPVYSIVIVEPNIDYVWRGKF